MLSKHAIRRRLTPCLLLLLCLNPCHADTGQDGVSARDAEQRRGVELARAGHYDDGIAVLTKLLEKYPGYYPAERDIVIITTWKGDCRAAVGRYELIRHHPAPESYLILPVSECLIKLGRFDEAVALLEEGQQRLPDNRDLATAYADAQARRAAQPLNELRSEAGTNTSDQGKREWILNNRLSRKLADRTRVYVRTANTRSSYEQYQSGKLDRIGLGVEHEFRNNIAVTQEFSEDVRRSGQNGSFTSIVFLPNGLWRFGASYTSFAEDLPLRAKAELIDAKRSIVFTNYHSADYRWSWDASASRYDFSDTNRRNSLFTSLGYAYELQPRREQRVFFEYYQSDNTLANTIYYNPSYDRSLSVVHKTDFVLDSRFRRHVDHLYLSFGQYDEQGFPSHGIWGVRYEQSYDFTDRLALLAGVSYGRHVYDGAGEYESDVHAVFRWLF